jgi:hypothetical protein
VLKLDGVDKNTLQAFICEICEIIKEDALDAKKEKDKAEKCKDEDMGEYMYATGRLISYYEVVSTIINQAGALGIDLKDLKLDDINPDKDLI